MGTTAPHVLPASNECKLQHLILAEIIERVNDMKANEVKKVKKIYYLDLFIVYFQC